MLLFLTVPVWAGKVTAVRTHTTAEKTRVVLSLSQRPSVKNFQLEKPSRWVLDLKSTQLATQLPRFRGKDEAIQSIRHSGRKQRNLRLVFELAKPIQKPKIFFLKATKKQPLRLVIDLPLKKGSQQSKVATATHKSSSSASAVGQPAKTAPSSAPANKSLAMPWLSQSRPIIVVLDPGHGGKDPGAIGAAGVKEKTVVLQIAKRLQKAINQEPGMRAVMTRSRDRYLTLRQRLRIARARKGDAFIAIHADAFRNRYAKGSSVYALSQRGASSEAAHWLANKENYSELGRINLEDKSDLLRSVLLDLSQTATIGSGLRLGRYVLRQLSSMTKLHRRRVEQARFMVLKSPDIPSILVETGFVSNPQEARRLSSEAYQIRLSQALLKGIKKFFWAHPPPGTWVAQQVRLTRNYRVKSGDSLGALADRYGVSVKAIQQFNALTSNQIQIGQQLRIPPIQER